MMAWEVVKIVMANHVSFPVLYDVKSFVAFRKHASMVEGHKEAKPEDLEKAR